MKRVGIRWMCVFGACAAALSAVAQGPAPAVAPVAIISNVQPELAAGAVMKEIDDPGSGVRWLLVEDPAHPGGPGRLIATSSALPPLVAADREEKAAAPQPVIRAGDQIQVEEHSNVVEATLEAVALSSAALGARLRVRLRVGGRVIVARALSPGHAALVPAGDRP